MAKLVSLNLKVGAPLFPERRSLENPATPLSAPADWLFDTFGGPPTLSGAHINERTALQMSIVYACVRVIAESIASLPLHVYKKTFPRGREKADSRREYYLLHDEPNDRMTSCIFREVLMGHVLLWGNGYARIVYDGSGKTTAFWPLMPELVQPQINPATRRLRYIVTDSITGQKEVLLPEDVLHIPGLSFDGVCGLSPIKYCRESFALTQALQDFGAEYFGNGTRPGGVLETPKTLSDPAKERLSAAWRAMHGGRGNRHKVAILEEGMKFSAFAIPAEDAQFIQSRKFQLSEIARIYRVPAHMVGDLEKATYSNIEYQSVEFVQYTLRGWLVRWEQELNRKLFPGGEYFVEHSIEGLLRGDFKTRMDGFAVGRQWGWLSVNDIRELENMNPLPGVDGDQYLAPLNMTTPAKIENPPQPPAPPAPAASDPNAPPVKPPKPQTKRYVRHVFADAMRRSLNYESRDPVKLEKFVGRAFAPVLCSIAEMTGGDLDAAIRYADILHSRLPEWAKELDRRQGQATPMEAILEEELEAAYAFIAEREFVHEA